MNRKTKKCMISFFLLLFLGSIFAATVQKVYVTANGKKFHTRYCRTLKKAPSVYEMSREEALKQGYSACKVCNP